MRGSLAVVAVTVVAMCVVACSSVDPAVAKQQAIAARLQQALREDTPAITVSVRGKHGTALRLAHLDVCDDAAVIAVATARGAAYDEMRAAFTWIECKRSDGDLASVDLPYKGRKLEITRIIPARGDATGGEVVIVQGNRFIKDGVRSVKVYFGGVQAQVLRFSSDTELQVQVPGGKLGETVDVTLAFEPGGVLTLTKAYTFE